jgi:peptide/nickel transport system substrate-binding protein
MKTGFYHFTLSILVLVFASCAHKKDTKEGIQGKGDVNYGGVFSIMSSEKIGTLFPISSSSIYTHRMGSQLFETLLKTDPISGSILPSLAYRYTINETTTKFTFHLRKGVFFHDDPCFPGNRGRELNAYDIKKTLEYACSDEFPNEIYWLLISKIQGAKSYYSDLTKRKEGISGIQIIDENTLSIQLRYPFVGFDKLLVHGSLGIFPQEAVSYYGKNIHKHPIGTGPFKLKKWNSSTLELERNNKYWRFDSFGNKLPYLDGIKVTYAKEKKDELNAYRKKQIHAVLKIPAEDIEYALGNLADAQAGRNIQSTIDSKSALHTAYLGYSVNKVPYNNVKVRQALNQAINLDHIVDNILQGDGFTCINGFVPAMPCYNSKKVKATGYNIIHSKEKLAEAGYPLGTNFPIINYYVNANSGSTQHKIAIEMAKQWKEVLHISTHIVLCSIEERDKAIISGAAHVWRGGWIADYADPENFLNLFYSKNIQENSATSNPFKYNSKQFDLFFEKAMREQNQQRRESLFVKCDQKIIDEAIILPLFNQDFTTMINKSITNFTVNDSQIIDFSIIFFDH